MFSSALNEAMVLLQRGELDPAIGILTDYLNGDFFHDEALFMLGGAFLAKGKNGLAAVLTSAAIDARTARQKTFPEALLNLGNCYKAEHQRDTAARIWADALNVEPLPKERSKILTNIATLYINDGQPAKALRYAGDALALWPENDHAQVAHGLASLEMGRWQEGWDGWRHTYATGDRHNRRYRDLPEWDGAPGKTVIVWGDQGIGDEIFYAACLKDMIGRSQRVILDCHPRLPALFQRSFPGIEVHGTRKNLGDLRWLDGSDAQASVCLADLPYHFRKNGEWDGKPYLAADRSIAPHSGRRLRVGLSWTGGTKKTRSDLRSLDIGSLEPILRAAPEAEWFSLQYTASGVADAARQVCELEERTGIRISHYPGWVECFDYDRTACFVSSLDLIITVCTTVHHLGGALGIPTWTLVPARPSWRYQLSGDRLPWYDSVRLFRQETDGDWSGAVGRIAEGLKAFRCC